MKIYCLRHGLTELNKQDKVNGEIDEPLAPEGIKQAQAAASILPKSIKHIYTSPMLRARQTAKFINSKLKRPIYVEQGVTEIHMGYLAGKAWTEMESGLELKKKHRGMQFDYRTQGGESIAEVKKRIISFLKKIQDKHQNYEVLIITHGGIIRTLHMLEHNEQIAEAIKHTSLHTFDLDKILNENI